MRKHIMEQLSELLSTIKEAHNEIRALYNSGDMDSVLQLFENCQTAAISVGTQIEESEGEGTGTVGILEDYCEMLYNTSLAIRNNSYDASSSAVNTDDSMAGNSIYNGTEALDKVITDALDSLNNDIPIRKEVIFLPYNASMWDSLESVWKKYDADPEYDAYVIPIPYYDKNKDGTIGEVHYEGNEYPDYVPITSYKEYDIPSRHPDAIYIHNPYDGYNKVTSVFPEYYSSNLKKYTDELVYIPYFIVYGDEVPEHLILLPGVIHAHKVIVQSEAVKKAYIEGLRSYAVENNINPSVFGNLDEKILALGSPKIDKVKNTTRDDVIIPEEWKKFTESGRKIILYNTSLHALMNDHEIYLDKLRRVFDIFRNNEDVILWWRPHPLMAETIEAMYPDMYNEYKDMVEEYIAEGFGIYDDTSDINRAIVVSDAYYGDMSSVVELYRATEKPIMIQNLEV